MRELRRGWTLNRSFEVSDSCLLEGCDLFGYAGLRNLDIIEPWSWKYAQH